VSRISTENAAACFDAHVREMAVRELRARNREHNLETCRERWIRTISNREWPSVEEAVNAGLAAMDLYANPLTTEDPLW
jgi:hypothetical protein